MLCGLPWERLARRYSSGHIRLHRGKLSCCGRCWVRSLRNRSACGTLMQIPAWRPARIPQTCDGRHMSTSWSDASLKLRFLQALMHAVRGQSHGLKHTQCPSALCLQYSEVGLVTVDTTSYRPCGNFLSIISTRGRILALVMYWARLVLGRRLVSMQLRTRRRAAAARGWSHLRAAWWLRCAPSVRPVSAAPSALAWFLCTTMATHINSAANA